MGRQFFRGLDSDIGHRDPFSSVVPDASRNQTMKVRVRADCVAKCLWDGDDAGTSPSVADVFVNS